MLGTVKMYREDKGFGFITPDNGDKDVFFHIKALQSSGVFSVVQGQRVSFEIGSGRDGRTAAKDMRLA